ncbi:MAG: hypothetical protein CML23_06485 [Rhizobiaceae bacterium]|nr:hypothetical protein [Rhizobiaceae bacterium]|tara:strand:+ start:887 stop:2212 length:1326 start_codon:yes stop_codon:yes gene_type:complete
MLITLSPWLALGALAVLLLLRVPVAIALALPAFAGLATELGFGSAAQLVGTVFMQPMTSYLALTISFLVLADTIILRGGIARCIADFAHAITFFLPGSTAQANVQANLLHGAFSGLTWHATAHFSKDMRAEQEQAGIDPAFSTALNIGSGAAGLVLAPSLLCVIVAFFADISITTLFFATLIPGVQIYAAITVIAIILAAIRSYRWGRAPSLRQFACGFSGAILLFLALFILLGTMGLGFLTANEAIALFVACLLSLAIAIYLFTAIANFKHVQTKLPAVFVEAAVKTAAIILTLGAAQIVNIYIKFYNVPAVFNDVISGLPANFAVQLAIIILLMILASAIIGTIAAAAILVPVFLPVAGMNGMDMVQFGVVIVLALSIASILPKTGVIFKAAQSVSAAPTRRILPWLMPFLGILVVELIRVAASPQVSLNLPDALPLTF